MIVTPLWNPDVVPPNNEDTGGGPDLGMRLAMAQWIDERLKKKGTRG